MNLNQNLHKHFLQSGHELMFFKAIGSEVKVTENIMDVGIITIL